MKENVYIIIHGFGGGLYEIEYLAHYLRSKGLDVHTVLLAGHGSTKKNLKKHSYLDWIHSVNITVSKLKRDYKYIHMIGFSMGGLIITHFTAMFEINKIVFINTPIYFWNIRIILRDVINGILSRKYERINFYKKSITGTSLSNVWVMNLRIIKVPDISRIRLEQTPSCNTITVVVIWYLASFLKREMLCAPIYIVSLFQPEES